MDEVEITTSDDEPDEYKYRQMLVSLVQLLDKNHVELLAVLAGFSTAEQDEILQQRDGWSHQLLRRLEQKGKIRPDDVSWLTENLEEINHKTAQKIVEKYESEPLVEIPDEPESDDSDVYDCQVTTFEDFLADIGLQDKFPQKLTLKEFLRVKDTTDPTNLVESFWQRLTSLDYRAGFPQNYMSRDFSMRDFIFSILHCADDFLRQDILEKMSACQLAVPVVLQGVNKGQPEFLLWALRRIMKKWKGQTDPYALEQQIVIHPVFMVSVLRIGDVRISKSQLLNTMLGYSQGNAPHAFFLSMEKDFVKPLFSPGSIECAWFLPLSDNEKEIFPEITAFFNLRGDCRSYPEQTKFACKVADLTIAFIATSKRNENLNHISNITKRSKRALFVAIRDQDKPSTKAQKVHKPDFVKGWLFVKVLQVDVLSREICQKIILAENKPENYKSLESLRDSCGSKIKVDENKTSCQQAKKDVQKKFTSLTTKKNIIELKKECFPLQGILKDWVQIDNERFQADNGKSESFEHQRHKMRRKQREKRKEQLQVGFSETIKNYHDLIIEHKNRPDSLRYIFAFLQEKIYTAVNGNIQSDLNQLTELKDHIKAHQKPAKRQGGNESGNTKSRAEKAAESSYRTLVMAYNDLHKSCRLKNLGCEHFLRELGQLFEAFDEIESLKGCTVNRADVALLPSLAARLVAELHSFELMDGDTGSVPLVWITNVLDALTRDLGDPRILVISVIGVQSSGKSTLLNSMFGLRFPVRAGRCTRGLFFRLLQLDETLAKELGFSHLVVVDTEGIRSIDHDDRRFDNELVTLALSIANITVFNIEGENISPDMTGILQIAAHALMRMKEVDLECHCRIVQQRVSDLTAAERNKAHTNRIIETLDEATKVAAEEEGLHGRYKKFSDVVDLQVDESLQYIPCLWTGGMSPPNHMYSDTVTKLKARLIQDIRDNKIIPDLSLSHFTDRVRDVWRAVKQDDFVFNFQDSVKAVSFNQFCLAYNNWIAETRQLMMLATNKAYRLLIKPHLDQTCLKLAMQSHEVSVVQPVDIELLKESIRATAEKGKMEVLARVDKYIAKHSQRQSGYIYKQGFVDNAKLVIKDIENQALATLNDEYELQQVKSDLPKFQKKWRSKLASAAKIEADALRRSGVKRISGSAFEKIWKKWMEMITNDMNQTTSRTPITSLQTVCEKLLLRITGDSAVGSEVRSLMKEEGGIDKHSQLPKDCSKYIHEKFMKAWLLQTYGQGSKPDTEQRIKQETAKVSLFVDNVVHDNLGRMWGSEPARAFNRNSYQLMLQRTLDDLTRNEQMFKPTNTLIAKGLLHLSYEALQMFMKYQDEHDYKFEFWLQNEKQMLFRDLQCFISKDVSETADRCADFLWYFMKDFFVQRLEEELDKLDNKITQYQYISDEKMPWGLLRHLASKKPHLLANHNLSRSRYELMTLLEKEWGMHTDNVEQEKERIIKELMGIFETWDQPGGAHAHANLTSWLNNLRLDVAHPFWQDVDYLFDSPNYITVAKRLGQTLISTLRKVRCVEPSLKLSLLDSHCGGCSHTCPMCGVLCSCLVPNHTVHSSFLHRPRGFMGEMYPNTTKLVLEDCTQNARTFHSKGEASVTLLPANRGTSEQVDTDFGRLFPPIRSHRRVYSDGSYWEIPSSYNPGIRFWHWVMARHNDLLATRYNCSKPDIPLDWFNITEEEAIHSLVVDEQTKLNGRFAVYNVS